MAVKKEKELESISVKAFYETFKEQLGLTIVSGERGMNKVIREKSINRPALALTGYFEYFANKRLQLFGAGEMGYMRDLDDERQEYILREIAKKRIPCMVVSRKLNPTQAMIDISEEYRIPLMRTNMASKDFSAQATVLLEGLMAPRTSLHGTLLDIRGIGVILRGKSGVGKSECALGLIERGHSLVADDLVYVKLISDKLIGRSAEHGRGYMECRGIGIINVAELFGISHVRLEKTVNLVVSFVEWQPGMVEDRTGLDSDYFELLGKKVPHLELGVRPGRDLARLVEVAALSEALKLMGYNTAQTFNERLIGMMK